MTRYSIFSLARNAFNNHRDWPAAWRSPEPKAEYDVIIIGGGGHGLATAFYLAEEHGVTNVAVLEKGWLGGGNTGRNTTIVRSNYLLEGNAHFYEKSMKLWETMSQELNFNVMMSHRGVLNLAHSDPQVDAFQRRGNAMRLNGIDAEYLDRNEIQRLVPLLDCSDNTRYPIMGGLLQPRGGTARHDAVAWGYARGADARGVDIIQNCEVTGIKRDDGRVTGVETTRGAIKAKKVGMGRIRDQLEQMGMAPKFDPQTSPKEDLAVDTDALPAHAREYCYRWFRIGELDFGFGHIVSFIIACIFLLLAAVWMYPSDVSGTDVFADIGGIFYESVGPAMMIVFFVGAFDSGNPTDVVLCQTRIARCVAGAPVAPHPGCLKITVAEVVFRTQKRRPDSTQSARTHLHYA